jgi:hypothetical protein
MSTIVYRDGILAADTRAFSGSKAPIGNKRKIFKVRLSDGSYTSFGVSTAHPGLSEEIRDWFASEKVHDAEPVLAGREFDALEITSGGEVFFYKDSFAPTGPLDADYYAIGSGAEYALGAFSMGADALTAIQIAGEHDVWTGGSVQRILTGPEDETPKKST